MHNDRTMLRISRWDGDTCIHYEFLPIASTELMTCFGGHHTVHRGPRQSLPSLSACHRQGPDDEFPPDHTKQQVEGRLYPRYLKTYMSTHARRQPQVAITTSPRSGCSCGIDQIRGMELVSGGCEQRCQEQDRRPKSRSSSPCSP